MNPDDPNPRASTEDAFLDLLTETLDTLERPARGQFLQRFLKSIARVDLSESESLEIWDKTLARKRELADTMGRRFLLQTALVDVLASADLLRLPILIEYEELRRLQISAVTDPLTGLYNRRFFDDYFEKELNRSSRYSHRLALIIFDLHRFKEVNDRYGHPQGDLLLQMAANTLRKSMRTSDYAFRIGGDEFALLLVQSDTEQASALSRRLRAAYASTIEPLRLGVPLALDFGLAVFPEDGEQQQVLIRVADERLYQLKKAGEFTPVGSSSYETIAPAKEEEQIESKTPSEITPIPAATVASDSIADAAVAGAKVTETSEHPPKPPLERRRWERVSLAGSHAFAKITDGAEWTARLLDLSYGGVAFETENPEKLEAAFFAVLHVPIVSPLRVSLKRVYQNDAGTGTARVGCAFVT